MKTDVTVLLILKEVECLLHWVILFQGWRADTKVGGEEDHGSTFPWYAPLIPNNSPPPSDHNVTHKYTVI